MFVKVDPKKFFSRENIKELEKSDDPFEIAALKRCNELMDEVRELRSELGLKNAKRELLSGNETPDISNLKHEHKKEVIQTRKQMREGEPFYKDWDVGGRAQTALQTHFTSLEELQAMQLKDLKKLDGVGAKTAEELYEKAQDMDGGPF